MSMVLTGRAFFNLYYLILSKQYVVKWMSVSGKWLNFKHFQCPWSNLSRCMKGSFITHNLHVECLFFLEGVGGVIYRRPWWTAKRTSLAHLCFHCCFMFNHFFLNHVIFESVGSSQDSMYLEYDAVSGDCGFFARFLIKDWFLVFWAFCI